MNLQLLDIVHQSSFDEITQLLICELERVYSYCPKPSSLQRQQLIRECSILANIEPKQIKVWFQNRRCRDKQRKVASWLQTVNMKLLAMNKLLLEEHGERCKLRLCGHNSSAFS
ncbi:hypothetical protein N665_0030s0074 [Sinapis alba]|nr:hypothetical protein N665_0030s0074 [Sinapis alba]